MVDQSDDWTLNERTSRLRRAGTGLPPRFARRLRRLCLAAITFAITVVLFAAVGIGLLFLRLSHGPVTVAALTAPVHDALASRLRPGFKIDIDAVDIETVDGRPTVSVNRMAVHDEAGHTIFQAPRAIIAIDPLQLVRGAIVPTRLDVRDLVLKLSVLPDGRFALSAGTDDVAPVLIGDAMAAGDEAKAGAAPGAAAALAPPPATAAAPLAPQQRFAAFLAEFIDRFSGADGSTIALDRFGVRDGTLILDDRTHDTVTRFRDLDIAFQKLSDTSSRLDVAAVGQTGRWSAHLFGAVHDDRSRTLQMDADGVTLDDLRAIPEMRDAGIDTDLVLAARFVFGLDPAGTLTVAQGHLSTGNGFIHLHDPDHEPFFIDSAESTFHLDVSHAAILVDAASLKADTTAYALTGQVVPPAAAGQDWTMSFGGHGVFGTERPGEKPVPLDAITIAGRVTPGDGDIKVDTFRLAGPQVDLNLQFGLTHTRTGLLFKGGAQAGRMPAPVMLRLWPTTVAADTRAWLLVNLQSGTVEQGKVSFALDDADLAKMHAERSVTDSHLRVDYAVSDVTLAFMQGVPPLKKASGHGAVTGDTSQFTVDESVLEVSPGRQLKVAPGSLWVPSTDVHPAPATIGLHVTGGVDVLTELLSRDALKSYADLPADLSGAHGQIDGTLTVGLKIGHGADPNDVTIGATAQIAGLTIDKLIGKQSLTDGQFGLTLDKAGMRIKGDARLFGAPTTVEVKKPAGGAAGAAVATLTLDDAARSKAGLDLGKQLTGPVTARVTVAVGGDEKPAAIDLDLTKATIANLLPGLSKSAGKPGRVTLAASAAGKGVSLDNIVCDIGAFALRGSASLDQDGGFQSARLTQLRLSPGDDMKVEATQAPDALKIVIHGVNIDARPFLKNLTGSDSSSGSGAKNVDVDLHSAVVTGQNSQALTGVDMKLGRRDSQLKRLQLSGRLGRAPFDVKSSQQGRDLVLDVVSGDAGATLTFLDLYKKVAGGQLDATIHLNDSKFDGTATIHSFSLREDPAMKRLTEEGLAAEDKRAGNGGNVQVDPSNISFSKLYVNFTKAGPRMTIRDGGMFGPLMGATVQGWIDLANDRLQLGGTYVPAYGVNNLFSQIPVFGQILGGGVHEGLLGINYRLTGSIASPNLTVDPLSALAPGFLRKIFGAITDATQEEGAPTVGRQQAPDTAAR